jgi:hypothetical protein
MFYDEPGVFYDGSETPPLPADICWMVWAGDRWHAMIGECL